MLKKPKNPKTDLGLTQLIFATLLKNANDNIIDYQMNALYSDYPYIISMAAMSGTPGTPKPPKIIIKLAYRMMTYDIHYTPTTNVNPIEVLTDKKFYHALMLHILYSNDANAYYKRLLITLPSYIKYDPVTLDYFFGLEGGDTNN